LSRSDHPLWERTSLSYSFPSQSAPEYQHHISISYASFFIVEQLIYIYSSSSFWLHHSLLLLMSRSGSVTSLSVYSVHQCHLDISLSNPYSFSSSRSCLGCSLHQSITSFTCISYSQFAFLAIPPSLVMTMQLSSFTNIITDVVSALSLHTGQARVRQGVLSFLIVFILYYNMTAYCRYHHLILISLSIFHDD